MIPKNRIPSHPGEILLIEFLEPWGISQADFARHTGMPTQRINEIVKGKRGISSETAWILSQAFNTSPEFWMTLQMNFDLAKTKPTSKIAGVKRAA